jgi:hypothetical protein
MCMHSSRFLEYSNCRWTGDDSSFASQLLMKTMLVRNQKVAEILVIRQLPRTCELQGRICIYKYEDLKTVVYSSSSRGLATSFFAKTGRVTDSDVGEVE